MIMHVILYLHVLLRIKGYIHFYRLSMNKYNYIMEYVNNIHIYIPILE